eukprot:10867961-Lingulodinium_polyedra.AAC.1
MSATSSDDEAEMRAARRPRGEPCRGQDEAEGLLRQDSRGGLSAIVFHAGGVRPLQFPPSAAT